MFSIRVLAQSAPCKATRRDVCEAQLLQWRDPSDPDAKPRNIVPCQWVPTPAPGRCVRAENVRFAEESERVCLRLLLCYSNLKPFSLTFDTRFGNRNHNSLMIGWKTNLRKTLRQLWFRGKFCRLNCLSMSSRFWEILRQCHKSQNLDVLKVEIRHRFEL